MAINAPDPAATAAAQAALNKQALLDSYRYNAKDVTGPFGSTTWQRDAAGNPTGQTVSLSPEMQQYYSGLYGQAGAATGAATGQISSLYGTPFDINNVANTDQIAQTSYNQQLGLLDPQFREAENKMAVDLANRGIPVGSEAYNAEMNRYQRQKESSLTNAAQSATLAASQEQQRLIGNNLAGRQQGFSELGAYNSATPNLMSQTPTAQSTPSFQAAAPDYTGVVNSNYSGQVSQANAATAAEVARQQMEAQKKGSMWSGIAGLGSAAIGAIGMLSDENMKTDRHPSDGKNILLAFRDMPVDDYRYTDEARSAYNVPENRTGTMAQDYAEHFGGDGHSIDMPDAIGRLMAAVKELDRRTAKDERRVR